jgi:ATP-binding cassette subfamily B protein
MTLVVALFFLTLISPVAGIIMIGVTFFYMCTSIYLNHQVQAVCTPLDVAFRRLNRWRVERWDEIERVKANAKEREEELAQRADFDIVIERDRTFWIGYIGQISLRGTVADIAVIVVLSYAFYMIVYAVSPWQVGTLVPIFMWCRNVRNNLWRIGHIEHRLNWNLPSVKSTMEALTIQPDIVDAPDAVDLPDGPVEIEIVGLTHSFVEDGESTDILRNISLKLAAGKRTAIIGPSGAGKSTFMRMLLRHMDPQKGIVRVNGVDLKKLRLASFLGATGYISQKAQIFDGTIRDNLLYGLSPSERAEVSDEQILALMAQLNLRLEGRLKQGLDTVVGRSGVKLSGGEAQRVMIAAAAMKKPRLMVIDEATSSLDVLTEAGIHEGLEKVLTDDITAVIITHRLPTVRHLCDCFVVLRPVSDLANGDPQVEAVADSFEELYKISPTFREMADMAGLAIG